MSNCNMQKDQLFFLYFKKYRLFGPQSEKKKKTKISLRHQDSKYGNPSVSAVFRLKLKNKNKKNTSDDEKLFHNAREEENLQRLFRSVPLSVMSDSL